jgi:hypothetical protein
VSPVTEAVLGTYVSLAFLTRVGPNSSPLLVPSFGLGLCSRSLAAFVLLHSAALQFWETKSASVHLGGGGDPTSLQSGFEQWLGADTGEENFWHHDLNIMGA